MHLAFSKRVFPLPKAVRGVAGLPEPVLRAARRAAARVTGGHLALMIFGSYARGEGSHSARSDIDVLLLVREPRRGYRQGPVNVSAYTAEALAALARRGSLFVLHLRTDGVTVEDPGGLLNSSLSSYRAPLDYAVLHGELCAASRLLDTVDGEYQIRWHALHRTGIFLLRTACYARCAQAGHPAFGMGQVSRVLGDCRLESAYLIKQAGGPCWGEFVKLRELVEEYLDVHAVNPFGSLEALLINADGQSPLTVSLGLRVLNSGTESGGDLYEPDEHSCRIPALLANPSPSWATSTVPPPNRVG